MDTEKGASIRKTRVGKLGPWQLRTMFYNATVPAHVIRVLIISQLRQRERTCESSCNIEELVNKLCFGSSDLFDQLFFSVAYKCTQNNLDII